MAKAFSLFAAAALALVSMQSCEKLDFRGGPPTPVNKTSTETATLKQNASYSLKIAPVSDVNTTAITTDAAHASVSTLNTDADGNAVYAYTPATDYAGPDKVVITMTGIQNNGTNPNVDGKLILVTTINISVLAK